MTLRDALLTKILIKGAASPYVVRASRSDLLTLFHELGFLTGAEIGVWKGDFSRQMCEQIPSVRLLCVDPWLAYETYQDNKNNQSRLDAAYQEASDKLTPYGCTLMRMTSLEAAEQVADGSLDFVYIDGNHREECVQQDLEAWTPKIKAGGILSGHDYITRSKQPDLQVKPAVDRFTQEHVIDPWFIFTGDKTPSFAWMV